MFNRSSCLLVTLGWMANLTHASSLMDDPVIGIDLGSAYSGVGIYKDGHVEMIPNKFGDIMTPSVVSLTEKGIIVGKLAKDQ